MGTIRLDTLRTRIRQRANLESTTFVTDSELTTHINASIRELYDLLVVGDPDLLVTVSSDFAVTGSSITLTAAGASDTYKIIGVDYKGGGGGTGYQNVRRHTMFARNDQWTRAYRISGSTLYFMPADSAAGTYRIWYIPNPTDLSSDSDTTEDYNGWIEYVVLDCAVKIKTKEGGDTAGLRADKAAMRQRILESCQRDMTEPPSISDNGARSPYSPWY